MDGDGGSNLRGLRPLRAVLASASLAAGNTGCVEGSANDVIANPGKILYATSANEDERVLLKIVADAGNVGGNLNAVRQPDTRDLAKC